MSHVGLYRRLKSGHLLGIPVAVAVLFLAFILLLGVPWGRDFKGGSLVVIQGLQSAPEPLSLESALERSLGKDVDVLPAGSGFHIETDVLSETEEANLKGVLSDEFAIPTSSVTVVPVGPAISAQQGELMLCSIAAAFVVMGVITLVIFKRGAAPAALLLSAGVDILCLLGFMSISRLPFNLASAMAILMVLIYAVDTNILLAHQILKGVGGEPKERAAASVNTGLMIGALLVAVFLSLGLLTGAAQLKLLAAMVMFGIVMNIFNTWFLSAGILLRCVERQRGEGYHVSP
jgi:preprotein translocase subunit SecF